MGIFPEKKPTYQKTLQICKKALFQADKKTRAHEYVKDVKNNTDSWTGTVHLWAT